MDDVINTDEQFLKEAASRIRSARARASQDIIAIGRDLIAVKERLGHGNFLPWIEREFGMSEDTAQNLMRVAANIGDQIPNGSVFQPTVLYELAAPSTPPEVRTEVIERVKAGETVTVRDVKEKKRKAASTKKSRKPKAKPKDTMASSPTTAPTEPTPQASTRKDTLLPVQCHQLAKAVSALSGMPPAQVMVRDFSRDMLDASAIIMAEQIEEVVAWLTDFKAEFLAELKRQDFDAPPTAPTNESLVWKQSLISVTLDDGVTYHEQIADIAEAVWYRITAETKPNGLMFSHYVVRLNEKVIGRAHALDEAKKLAQQHADDHAHPASGQPERNRPADLPRERAKTVLRQDSALTKREVMQRAECGSKAAVMARRELEEAGEIAPKAKAEAA